MNEDRLSDYLDHIRRAASDACSFVEGLSKEEFLADKRTQQAVIMSLVIIGEARLQGNQGEHCEQARKGNGASGFFPGISSSA